MIHLLPSNSILGGFFVLKLSGFAFFGGAGDTPRVDDELSLRVGTVDVVRSEGFLCVICEASTFFKPLVTPSPLFKSANIAPRSAPPDLGIGGRPPGGGGGGGGGPPLAAGGRGGGRGAEEVALLPDLRSFIACMASTPLAFHWTPRAWCCLIYAISDRMT